MIRHFLGRLTNRNAESAAPAADASVKPGDAPVTSLVDTPARVGVLTQATYELLDGIIQKYGLTTDNGKLAEQALKSLAQWPVKMDRHGTPVFEHEADKKSVHKCVMEIIETFGSRYRQVGAGVEVKPAQLKAAQIASGNRDTDDILQQLGRMSRQVQGAFSEKQLAALKNPKDRLPLRHALLEQRELVVGMRTLRAEATALLGEEMMRHNHVHQGITGSPDSHLPDSSKAPKKGHGTYSGKATGCNKPRNQRGPQPDPMTVPVNDGSRPYNRYSR